MARGELISVTVDKRQLRDVERLLAEVGGSVNQVLVRAVNKVATSARAHIVTAMWQMTPLTQTELRKRYVTLHKATSRRMDALIRVRGGRIPVIRLKPKQTRSGVSYSGGRGRGRVLIPDAFISLMPARSYRGVFRRAGQSRLPIGEERTAGVLEAFAASPEMNRASLDGMIARKLEREVHVQTGLVIERRRGAALARLAGGT